MNVDFTLILGIIGVIFYVIVPLLAGNKKKGEQQRTSQAEQPKQPAKPQAATKPAAEQAEPRNLREFLQQIQQQVKEAEQEWQAKQQQAEAQPTPAEQPRPVPSSRPAPQPAVPLSSPLVSTPERRLADLGSSVPKSQGLGRIRPRARRASVRTFTDTDDEPNVVRDAFVQVTPDRVLHGLIWHEILSEPKGLRGMRRSRLPLR